jgi:hypothetical protein
LLGKLLPAVLAGVAAITSGLLGVEQPHERWVLYRRFQRLAEAEELRYDHRVSPYDGTDAEEQLAGWVAQAKVSVHEDWTSIVPKSADVGRLGRATHSRSDS